MSETKPTDRRRDARYLKATYAALLTQGENASDQAFGIIVDVSARGVCVRTPQPPPLGQLVTLRIAVEEAIHEIRAVVRRVKKRGGAEHEVGLELNPESSASRQLLRELLPCLLEATPSGKYRRVSRVAPGARPERRSKPRP